MSSRDANLGPVVCHGARRSGARGIAAACNPSHDENVLLGALRRIRARLMTESVMSNSNQGPRNKANHYIFAGVGAVLGGLAGAGMAGLVTAVAGAALGGLLGYNMLKRL
jgi:osmotically inducible lipoprotein OsmB